MLRSVTKLTILCAASTIVWAAGTAGAAEVYKYKDDKGNTLYTDKPITLPAERLNVQTARKSDSSSASTSSSDDEQKRMQEADAARKQDATQKSDDKQVAQSATKDKIERCTKARDKYEAYLTSRRLYEDQPDGKRRYLTSEELDSARAAAKMNMDVWCK
jgi:Domain of unknown function (DUF4124)